MTKPGSSSSEHVRSSEYALATLRMLFIPFAVLAVVLYLPAMLGAIMVSDSGTDTAIKISLWSMFALTFYVASALLVAVRWSSWPRGSATLLSILTFINVVPLVMFPSVTIRTPLVFLGIFGIRLGDVFAVIVGGLFYVAFLVLVPALSSWMLFRRASEEAEELSHQATQN